MRFPAVCCTALLVALTGCSDRTPAPPPPPPPPPPSAWTPVESRQAADDLIGDALKRPWVNEFHDRTSHLPGVRVGDIADRSQGQVDVSGLSSQLARALAASGRVTLVQGSGKADFIIQGSVSAEDGQSQGEPVKRYEIDLKLVDCISGDAICPLPLEVTKSDKVPTANEAPPAPAVHPAGAK